MGVPTPIVFVLMLGILVFVHELGHFLAAKAVGVAVEEFAFGFGPRLVTLLRRGGTDYTIHALPLGGFVNLVGMQPEEVHIQNGLMSKPAWARALVFTAGPAMNFVLAIVVLCSMGILTGVPTGRANVVMEPRRGTEAVRVGLKTGDRIVALDGQSLGGGNALIEAIESHPGQQVLLTVERDGKLIQVAARPTPELQLVPQFIVDYAAPGSPAAKLGLRPGDRLAGFNGKAISGLELEETLEDKAQRQPFTLNVRRRGRELTFPGVTGLQGLVPRVEVSPLARHLGLHLGDRIDAVAGRKVRTREELAQALRAHAGQPVVLSVERDSDGAIQDLPAQVIQEQLADPEQVRTVGKMGFAPGLQFQKTGFAESVRRGWEQFLAFFVSLYGMAASGRLGKSAGSVVTMYRATEMYSKLGAGYMLGLAANLSLSLAVFNLFPIPVLDGGHLALLGVEVVRRRRLGPAAYRVATVIGFAVVVAAFVLLMYLDVMKVHTHAPLINP